MFKIIMFLHLSDFKLFRNKADDCASREIDKQHICDSSTLNAVRDVLTECNLNRRPLVVAFNKRSPLYCVV